MRDASTVKTHKVYYDDAYAREFVGHVVSAQLQMKEAAEDGGTALLDVVLDQTAFFPEEGGQSADTGTLAGFPVRDVQIEGGEIHHFVDVSGINEDSADALRGTHFFGTCPQALRP